MEPTKLLLKNAKTLKDLENGMLNKRLAETNDVSRNTVSTWVKNKKNLLASLEKKVQPLNDRSWRFQKGR